VPLPSLLLFARAPEPGRVKTRLAGRLTEAGAADLYHAFLADAARVYLNPRKWSCVLCAEPDPPGPRLEALFPGPWVREAQAPGNLGDRLRAAFRSAFARGAPAAVAIGSDHPTLPLERLEDVFDALARGTDAAIVPAEDGGYCAIGLAAVAPVEAVFRDIAWSTDAVLRETVERLECAGVGYRLLPPGYDVDRPEDLDRLRRDLAERDPASEDYPTATARMLGALIGGTP
jgi:rSAM/selenodomain-associated transferase 1